MVLWKFTYREIRNRPGRAILTLLSIVIAVAAVVAVQITIRTTRQAYKDMYENLTGRAALEVVAELDGSYDENLAAKLTTVPGVKAAVAWIQRPTILYHEGKRVQMIALGVDPARDEAVRDYDFQQGAMVKEEDDPPGALLEVGLARNLGVKVGDEIKLQTGRMRTAKVAGLLNPKGSSGLNQGGIVVLPLGVVQEWFRMPDSVNYTSIVLTDGADEKKVHDAIAALLPAGMLVRATASRAQMGNDTMRQAEQGLNFAFALMLALALVMILNTFLMNVGERRRQISILRAIGATRGEVLGMLLNEGLFVGLVGTVLGSLAGVGGAYVLTGAMTHGSTATVPSLHLTWMPFVLAAVLGPMVSVAAMLLPARIASKVSPLEGMRPIVAEPNSRVPVMYILAGAAIFALMGSGLAACVMGYLPVELSPYVGVAFTAAFLCLIPSALEPCTTLAAKIIKPFLGPEGQIAARQVIRRRMRTTLTVGVLYIAVSSGVSLGTVIINNVANVRTWYDRTLRGDILIRAVGQELAAGSSVALPDSLGDEIRGTPGIEKVETIRFQSVELGDQGALLLVRDFADPNDLPIFLIDAKPKPIVDALAAGEVVIGSVLAQKLHKAVGDTIDLPTGSGTRPFRIAALSTEYFYSGMIVNMERNAARKFLHLEGSNWYIIRTASLAAQNAVEVKLKTICDRDGYLLQSFGLLRARFDSMLNGVVVCLWGLLGLGLVVAAFGIANTLTMNVLEQTRELAMLRVVAMTRSQVRKTIVGQGVVIGLIGLISGSIGGIVGAYTTNITSMALNGVVVKFALHPGLICGSFLAAFAIVLLAAWIPAERAARLNLLLALQYE